MTTTKPTCGPMYAKARDIALGLAKADPALLFGGGFVVGQAEKIYSGACKAAMFRPEQERRDGLRMIAKAIAPVYGLEWGTWEDEIWLFGADSYAFLNATLKLPRNSPEWHRRRAALCGIRDEDIDERFHERYA